MNKTLSTIQNNLGSLVNSPVTKYTEEAIGAYMRQVFSLMSFALLLTTATAFTVENVAGLHQIFFKVVEDHTRLTLIGWGALLAPLAIVFAIGSSFQSKSAGFLRGMMFLLAACFGITLSSILSAYTTASLASTFAICTAMFGGLAFYGYTTKSSLTKAGDFAIMGLIGLIIAMVVNIFLKSAMMDFVLSGVGVLVFTILTAYDTQKVKGLYDPETADKSAVMGALTLYLDFVNLFLFLLKFMGNRK